MAKTRPRGRSGGGNNTGPRIGTGGGGGGTKGRGAKGGSTSSSSVNDGVKYLVMGICTSVVVAFAGIVGFLVHGYGLI